MISISLINIIDKMQKKKKLIVNRIKYKFVTTQKQFNLRMVSDLQKYTIVFLNSFNTY